MRILITGAGGMLARYLYKLLSKQHDVIALTRSEFDVTANKLPDQVTSQRFDYIVNCSAYTNVDRAEKHVTEARLVNAVGARNLALLSKRTGARLVTYSTDFIFDGKASKPYGVFDKANPLSSYGTSKWIGECMVRDVGCEYLILRTSWLFGAGKRNFISAVLERAQSSSRIDVVVDQVGNPTYAYDLAEATIDLMTLGTLGTFHVSNQGHCSRAELAKEAIRLAGFNCDVVEVETALMPGVAYRPPYSVLDAFPLEVTLGRPMPHWQDALERYLVEEASGREGVK